METIRRYFPTLARTQLEQFERLFALYTEWNAKINVISRKDINHLYLRHVLHSLSIAKVISFKDGTEVLDAGTGGGFPGIPLAIFFPDVRFHLIDSIGKKIKVVESISGALNLNNVSCEQVRAENLNRQWDFIVSRAVTALPGFIGWVGPFIRKKGNNELKNGILYLKGGELDDELSQVSQNYRLFKISDYFSEDFFARKFIVYLPVGDGSL